MFFLFLIFLIEKSIEYIVTSYINYEHSAASANCDKQINR